MKRSPPWLSASPTPTPSHFLKLVTIRKKNLFLFQIYLLLLITSNYGKNQYKTLQLIQSQSNCLQNSFMCVICSFNFCPISMLLVNVINFEGTTTPFPSLMGPVISRVIKLLGFFCKKQMIRNGWLNRNGPKLLSQRNKNTI